MNRINVLRYSGILAIFIYLTFTFISYQFYPSAFSPLTNWLSDLGNPLANPIGWYFYNAGCMMISILSVIFYFGLRQWRFKNRKNRWMIRITQLAGAFSSLALFITALFPLGPDRAIHNFWSFILYIGLGIFEIAMAFTTFQYPMISKCSGIYGIMAMLVNYITLGLTFFDFFIGEWITVVLFFIYIIIITCQYDKYMGSPYKFFIGDKIALNWDK